jgi:hypothetical protein
MSRNARENKKESNQEKRRAIKAADAHSSDDEDREKKSSKRTAAKYRVAHVCRATRADNGLDLISLPVKETIRNKIEFLFDTGATIFLIKLKTLSDDRSIHWRMPSETARFHVHSEHHKYNRRPGGDKNTACNSRYHRGRRHGRVNTLYERKTEDESATTIRQEQLRKLLRTDQLNIEERKTLHEIYDEFCDILFLKEDQLTCTSAVTHEIST